MSSFAETLRNIDTITFDCYGTLVDWRAGFIRAFRMLFGEMTSAREQALFEAYFALEAKVEAEAFRPYREVLTESVQRLATRFEFDLTPGRAALLPESLPDWPVFPDTNEALNRLKRRFRLGVLSNVDQDLFAGTASHFEVAFDFVVTAQDVGSYKPGLAHFERMLAEHGSRETTLHVAQSLYHDGGPAERLGLAYVWLNRYNQVNETVVRPVAQFADLKSFADRATG